MTHKKIRLLIAAAVLAGGAPVHAAWQFDTETGIVSNGYNDVKIPGDTGTLFSLSNDLNIKNAVFFRETITRQLTDKSSLALLIAPLTLQADGKLAAPVNFSGTLFPANTDVDASYTFNSYRLSYRYLVHQTDKLESAIGFTAKIRDAAIKVKGGGLSAEKTNVGLVPLLYFRVQWNATPKAGLLLEGDALAAPQGRAEDILLAARYALSGRATLKAGYRIVEGGADNKEVYNFALLNYAVIGITFTY